MSAEYVLETLNLKKYFGPVKAVDGVSLGVRRGEVFGFLGPNGAGKTTTIGMILGLLYPSAGSVYLFGQQVTPTHNGALRRVGSLTGAPALVPYLSARQNLQLLARLHGNVTRQRIDEMLKAVGLLEAADRATGGFSSGMKQRLGLAMALLHQPEVLILDEPTNGMDPAGMREVRTLLRSLANDGATVFLSSHLLHEVEQICDRVAVLQRGKLVAMGPTAQLMGDRETVRVEVPSPAEAARLLQTLPGVDDVQPNGRYVEVRGVSSEAVVAHLTGHGIIPGEVTRTRPDLESLFLELTQEPADKV